MTLHLIPNLLDETAALEDFLLPSLLELIPALDGLICESEKAARRFLAKLPSKPQLTLSLLNEHTDLKDLPFLLEPLIEGENWGLISDAGLPCLADPGSNLVLLARQKKIKIHAYPGPSSLIMALMLSGLPVQRFAFHGYLPRKEEDLRRKLRELEKASYMEESSQVWIEAPYRSGKILEMIKKVLRPHTLFCVAQNLTFSNEMVETALVSVWKKKKIEKGPAVFLLYSEQKKTSFPIRKRGARTST